ncbi:hypothetical protein BHE74_00015611 [Ensete ventricosum]|nr:hypothetical protein BHE74_00015611 [Ensete ventricosum]RZR79745.1 hypothetical protein BHM03_00005551 [Ensete ventricosum]
MCRSVAEEAMVLFLDGGRSCTWRQQQRREVRMKAPPSDSSIGGRGSVGPVRSWRRWCHDIGREHAANRPLLKMVFQVAQLRQRFFHSIAPGGLAGDRRGVVPASGFSISIQQIWKVIRENKDLDLPAHKVSTIVVTC